ncbi:MAG: sugar phosphate isomerase/epimerase [Acidimicrobiia bacterium]
MRVVGQQSQEASERSLGGGWVVRVEREQGQDSNRDDDADGVARPPARALVGNTADECAEAAADVREQGWSLAYLLAVTTLGRDDLVLTASSVGCPPFPTLVEAAVHGGFAGLSLWPPETYGAALEAGYRALDLRAMLDDANVVAYEVDALVAWAGPGDPGEPYLQAAPRAFVLDTAAALGARQSNAIIVGERGTSHEAIAEVVDGMCEEAATFGVRVGIEFARGSLVRTLADLVAVRALLPHRDVGITVDAWQIHWGPSTLEELAEVPGAAVFSVQLDDAPAVRPDDFGRATYEGRLVPGVGAADLTGLLRALDGIGYDGPITVEAINADLIAATDPLDLALRLADATRAVIAQSRT